jgi:uncharacterized protein (TIGR02284 family)
MHNAISCLNNLIETSHDGQEGFKTCADHVQDASLKTTLMAASHRCASGVKDLQAEVRRLGGDPDTTGSVAGTAMRAWINIKSAITGKNDGAILTECERGEDHAVTVYKKALEEELSLPTRTLVETQYHGVKENHDKIRSLRDQYLAA